MGAKKGFYVGQFPTMPADQRNAYNQLRDQYQMNVGVGVDAYEGAIVPGATELHDATYASALDSIMAREGTAGSALERIYNVEPAFEIDPAARERYYDENVVAPALREYSTEILPRIMEQYQGSGLGRSGFLKGELAGSAADLETSLAGIRADLLYRDEMAERDASEAAYGRLVPGLAAGQAERESMLGVADTTRGIEGELLGEEYGKWLYEQPYNNPWLAYTEPVLGTPLVQNITGPKKTKWYDKVGPIVAGAFSGGGGMGG